MMMIMMMMTMTIVFELEKKVTIFKICDIKLEEACERPFFSF